ncbi:type II toxin-antitoxin system VapC family toxin [Kribbella sp. CA-293567]|uniref:type II toxin-antitoxin system VapC family toxin n=1 Tax=Kribbella sp. CA-293567 TaxID=3002436 RepID=UPI0022DE1F6B|nr:type II toxin-antitoxin system VapC family toxin [Kribbella sp. CA-293567]WBQ03136.1 type II toxin-antitoxin system VapC family toxin [Kribbella sp. CA-293567]
MTRSGLPRRLLLDTHVLLWWMLDGPELADELKDRIDTELQVYVSAATIWEISIKAAAGKLDLPPNFLELVERTGVGELPIRSAHADLAGRLPLLHRDPFDRMLIAQALTERLTLVTRNATIHQYDVPVLKA